MSRLVVVSNRVPLPSERGPRAGGLAVALADALRPGSLWFGWSGKRGHAGDPSIQQGDGISYATIDLTETEHRGFYVHFANGVLWPLLHFRLGLMTFRSEDYAAYRAVNRRFAATLAPLLRPDDLIWVHDYHLIPLAAELRALGVRNRIGFFLHTPFVPPAIMQALPRANELLEALCAYDVTGFHTAGYQQAFLDCVREMLGGRPDADGRFLWQGRPVQAVVDPVGIDADGFRTCAEQAAQSIEARQLRESLAGRALGIGVDRLDYSKGLLSRFEAIGRLFAHYPEHRRGMSFLQIAARSREEQGDYQRLRRELDRIVGDTNGRYSEFDWVPLRYMTRAVRRTTLAGFFRIARLAIVTPLRDGMNLVAKEYVAAQDPADPGVLILSRFAGAADSMQDALIVNPFDAEEVAAAIHRGLTMGLEERQQRWQALRESVWNTTAKQYCTVFLSYLQQESWSDQQRLRAAS
ncbi:MAG: trehalose-6-phosphate synthase [Rhodospirillales bacterium 69-11]|nr:trehalose-6-phosphate synthase [Rhodospirillales bacterium]OJW22319.1 MAG: trehalose-6-phosphate synthase [Rhodospirillales bacterium 69-11]